MADINDTHDANRDPITGAPGAHPIGTGVGAASAGATGAAMGAMVGGPVGAVIGGAIGAVAGGLAGKGVAEKINPTVEDAYWRDNYSNRPYVAPDASFADFGPAYGYGLNASGLHPTRSFDDAEKELAQGWEGARGTSALEWENARNATRDAWERVRSGRN